MNSSQLRETTRGVRRATFPHVNTLSRRPETRQLERKMRAHAMTRMFTDIFFPAVHHFVKYVTWPNEGQQTLNFM